MNQLNDLSRREVILTSATVVGVALAGTVLPGINNTAFAMGPNMDKILETTTKCIAVGLRCQTHCQAELAKGNKEMSACLTSVTDMLAACEAVQKLAAAKSKHTAAMAKTCATILADCAKTCEKHAKHMAICKECMEACNECEKACNAV